MTDYSARITALEDALGSGELSIEVEGRKVTYRSVPELLAALRELRRLQAAGSPSASGSYASTLATFGEG